jgi:hypothetical protein
MTRSGTSLTMRILNLLGVYLGPEDELLPARDPSNPKGFWEHDKLKRLNNAILREMGGRVHDPPDLPTGWEDSPALAPFRERASELVAERFADSPLWGWKDPRNCLTLPFWQKLLPPMHYVVCIRNPLEVAASLEKRGGMPVEKSMWLWLRYVSCSIAHTAGRRRMFVFFEDYFEDWRPQVDRLARFIDVSSALDSQIRELSEESIEKDLRHHQTGVQATAESARVPPEVKSLYLLLHAVVHERGGTPSAEADRSGLEEALNLYVRQLVPAGSEPAAFAGAIEG